MEKMLWKHVVSGDEAFHALRHVKTWQNPTHEHCHDFAEVFWTESGEGIHCINGQTLPLESQSLVWMRPQDRHAIEVSGTHTLRLTNIAFTKETLEFLQTRYFSGKEWALHHACEVPIVHRIDSAQLQRFNRWADELAQAPRECFYIERFLLNLLEETSPRSASQWPQEMPQWLAKACQQVQQPEHLQSGIDSFVRLTGYSREHVSRTLRQFLGMTPTEYVNNARMMYAAHQLEMSQQSILEISLECGIGNLSHFYTLFRAQYSTTPRAYRLAHHKTV
ncbi:MAG: helix-turn-helix domain-containing protein, partial [Proteobacteria bacterium]